jgi:hypothetical protein
MDKSRGFLAGLGEATAKIATGRSFDHIIVLKGESWAPLFFGEIGMLWDTYKQNEQEYRELRRTAKDMNERLGHMIGTSGVQGKVELNQAGGYGEIVIRGDLDQLQPLVDQLGGLSASKVDALQQLFADLVA